MSQITKDVEVFLKRAAAELLKANPGLFHESQINQEMVADSFEAVLKRDQELIDAVRSNRLLRKVLTLEAYNGARVEGLKRSHKRELADEKRDSNFRTARMINFDLLA